MSSIVVDNTRLYQLKLVELAEQVACNGYRAIYEYGANSRYMMHTFYVINDCVDMVLWHKGWDTAEDCYRWAVDECKKEGLI